MLHESILEEMGCNQLSSDAREECLEKAASRTNQEYKQRIPTCKDVVWHRGSFPTLRVCESRHRLIGSADKEIIAKVGTDCVLFATPDLKDQENVRLGMKDAILAICVDPDKVYVSEDVEDWRHSHYRDPKASEYYKSKLVTLREYREKQMKYELPEVLIPGTVSDEQVLGAIDIIDGEPYPYRCSCEEE
jgi:hypothetical protein